MKWIVSNQKTGLGLENIDNYINELNKIDISNVHLVICPNNKEIEYFTNNRYELGSQDINIIDKDVIKYSIIGHHDTRVNDKETNEIINKKLKKLLENNIIPILCVGEDLNENPINIIKTELGEGLKDITGIKMFVAYEPNWAINSGNIPDLIKLTNIIKFIKEEMNKFNINANVLYGGSVDEKTVLELEKISDLDGYLIGKASLEIDKLKEIIEVVK